ncbi:MAG: hypothetical protein R3C28_23380 [Pirellulaceae bacterium]
MHASVRESLASHLQPGMKMTVHVDSPTSPRKGPFEKSCRKQKLSRSVLVKVSLPQNATALYIGSFGRLSIPVGEIERIVVPSSAIQTLGQLDVVDVVNGTRNWLDTGLFV